MQRLILNPILLIPALVVLARVFVAGIESMLGGVSLPVTLLYGFTYRSEPLFPAAVAIVLGTQIWRYADLGVAQVVMATLVMFLLPFAANYLLAYYVAVYLPFQIASVEDYAKVLLSLSAAIEGACRLLVLSVCMPVFRTLLAWVVILACWSGATIFLLIAYRDNVIAASYPALVFIATLLGFAWVGVEFHTTETKKW